jgi:hypothetical protein
MKPRPCNRSSHTIHWLTLLGAALVLLTVVGPVQADLIVTVQSVTAAPGSTGNTIEVDLTNTGAGAAGPIGAFSFGLSTTNPGITFTAATTATLGAPYIFDGLGLFGPNITNSTGTSLTASDLFSVIGSGTTLGAGATVGLGEVFFDVAPGTSPGPIAVILADYPTTSLSDDSFPVPNDIPITTLTNGTITVTGTGGGGTPTPVPEPSTLALLGTAGAALAGWRWRRRGDA